jgi:hypothetical protein
MKRPKGAAASTAPAASAPVDVDATALSPPRARASRPRRQAAVKAAAESARKSARKKSLSWLDDEAGCSDEADSDSGDDSDDEGDSDDDEGDDNDDGEDAGSDGDFVVGDDDVQYDSDASSNAIEQDTNARRGVMPMPMSNDATPSPEAPASRRKRLPKSTLKPPRGGGGSGGGGPGAKGKTPIRARGVTFQSPGQHDVVTISDDDGEESAGSSPEPDNNILPPAPLDPYGLHELRTPTPPPSMRPFSSVATPGGGGGAMPPKTPKSTVGRKTGGGGYGGYGEPPPTHSKVG